MFVTFAMVLQCFFESQVAEFIPHSAFRIRLIHPVVRRFFGDHHVMHMRLAEAGARDLDELRPFLERLEASQPQ